MASISAGFIELSFKIFLVNKGNALAVSFIFEEDSFNILLSKGAEKARKIAKEVLLRVRKKIGY